jgi:mRNA interferase HicA
VKRRKLIAHLRAHGCELLREGSRHSVFINPVARKAAAVPRHTEINDFLARKICQDLDVPPP